MAFRTGTALCCADEMIVGRWYKLVGMPVGYGVSYNYKTTFSIDNDDIACLLFDTLYIKKTGSLTITVTDQYGNTDSKSVSLIEEPTVERTEYTISPATWEDFKTQVDACGEYSYINITQGDYHYTISDVGYSIPKGTVIDFNKSNIYVSTEVNKCRMFLIYYDFIEIRNANIINDCADDWEHGDQSQLISVYNGYMCKLEHLYFKNAIGFNIGIGTWGQNLKFTPYSDSLWHTNNMFYGYLNDSGELVESEGAYSSNNIRTITDNPERTYLMGKRDLWIPTTARVYDVAFYDSDENFIELRKNQQFYRKYKLPDNALYWRCTVYQDTEPTLNVAGDDYCIFRMYGESYSTGCCVSCVELYANDIIADGNESGVISVVGHNQDCHYNKIRCDDIGSVNPWSFDVEDAWNGTCGMVISHSAFRDGRVYSHGAQGLTLLSSIANWIVINSNPYSITAINSAIKIAYTYSIRNFVALANCSIGSLVTQNSESEYEPYVTNQNINGTWDEVYNKINRYYNNYRV